MMLPSDMCLRDDPRFRVHAARYAADEPAFFADFAAAYGKLLALGCPPETQPGFADKAATADKLSAEFRELCMHGSQLKAQEARSTRTHSLGG